MPSKVVQITIFSKNLTDVHCELLSKPLQVRMEFTPAYYSEYTKLLRNHKKLGSGGKGTTFSKFSFLAFFRTSPCTAGDTDWS